MQRYIIRRLLTGALILVVLSIAVFLLLRVAPGDPRDLRCPIGATRECRDAVGEELGLNDPLPVQYLNWMGDVLTGDLGTATFSGRPVLDSVKQRLPVTLELMILTMIATVVIGVPAGVISALYRNSPYDYLVRLVAVLGLAVPNFWLATLVIMVPNELWNYAPPLGVTISFLDDPLGNLRQFGPPAAVLGLASGAGIMRLSRSALLEVVRTDYIRTARAKGLTERVVIVRHALKNSLVPVTTVLGIQLAGLLGGSVIIEQIFALPGLGQYIFQAIFTKDYAVVQSMTLYIGAAVILMNLIVDVSYAWLDPRIRYS